MCMQRILFRHSFDRAFISDYAFPMSSPWHNSSQTKCSKSGQLSDLTQHGYSGNSQLLPTVRRISVLPGERDSSQQGSYVASAIQGQNSTPSSSPNHSRVADITQRITSTTSTAQRQLINTPTAMLGTSSCSTPAPGRTTQTDSTRRIVSSPTSGIVSTATPLRCHENLPTPIPDPEAHSIITNPLQTQGTEKNQGQRQWQLLLQVVSTPPSVISSSHSMDWLGHSDMTCLEFATGRLLEHYMWNRRPFMSASNLEMVSYATWQVAKALAEAPHWQIIETYWNTAMQQNNILSIAFEACTKQILKQIWWCNGPRWILHTQTTTSFEHKSIKLNPILFDQDGTT